MIQLKKTSDIYRVFNRVGRLANKFTTAEAFRTDQHPNNVEEPRNVSVWCSNDYLGMSRHPKVIKTACETIAKYGVGSGGTRNISGNNLLHEKLENVLASWYRKDAGLIFTSCYVANSTTLSTLATILDDCIIFSDQGNHASIIEGVRYSRCQKYIYKHNDLDDLETNLAKVPLSRHKLIVFESVNSMNGSISPIKEICDLAKRYNALTFLDEVHAVGLYGKYGSGYSEDLGCLDDIDIISGTLGKAVGSIGGFIVGQNQLVDMIRSYAPGFIFTTSLPPAIISSSIESIKILRSDEGQRLRTCHQNVVSVVRKRLTQAGFPQFPSPSHIIPILVGDSKTCKMISKRLLDRHNIYVQPINYPTVMPKTERLRIAPTPGHDSESVKKLVDSLIETWETVGLARIHPVCTNDSCDCVLSCECYHFNQPTTSWQVVL
ncbi:5-aminolevulinate synthase, nonspecific, mitochondrial [Thelohanellus kitauei]|uniref:5-aminolevulinate synthase n=1 Tax=Thelohanellus kitauei TaxID=669202 RepID=A0A0C2IVN2_THEKT|nr:5-aminolevulinate synthase, nonspecific, mitochondrial [Thelohanellus kitauei]